MSFDMASAKESAKLFLLPRSAKDHFASFPVLLCVLCVEKSLFFNARLPGIGAGRLVPALLEQCDTHAYAAPIAPPCRNGI